MSASSSFSNIPYRRTSSSAHLQNNINNNNNNNNNNIDLNSDSDTEQDDILQPLSPIPYLNHKTSPRLSGGGGGGGGGAGSGPSSPLISEFAISNNANEPRRMSWTSSTSTSVYPNTLTSTAAGTVGNSGNNIKNTGVDAVDGGGNGLGTGIGNGIGMGLGGIGVMPSSPVRRTSYAHPNTPSPIKTRGSLGGGGSGSGSGSAGSTSIGNERGGHKRNSSFPHPLSFAAGVLGSVTGSGPGLGSGSSSPTMKPYGKEGKDSDAENSTDEEDGYIKRGGYGFGGSTDSLVLVGGGGGGTSSSTTKPSSPSGTGGKTKQGSRRIHIDQSNEFYRTPPGTATASAFPLTGGRNSLGEIFGDGNNTGKGGKSWFTLPPVFRRAKSWGMGEMSGGSSVGVRGGRNGNGNGNGNGSGSRSRNRIARGMMGRRRGWMVVGLVILMGAGYLVGSWWIFVRNTIGSGTTEIKPSAWSTLSRFRSNQIPLVDIDQDEDFEYDDEYETDIDSDSEYDIAFNDKDYDTSLPIPKGIPKSVKPQKVGPLWRIREANWLGGEKDRGLSNGGKGSKRGKGKGKGRGNGNGKGLFEEEGDGGCQFVSVVEAYRSDLARLRAKASSTSFPKAPSSLEDLAEDTPQSRFSPDHTYSPTGHLLVSKNPLAPHPIPQLLTLGEKRWEEMLHRQSRSLEDAVEEYKRRYGRRPPKGFDIWWDFAEAIELVLPDEYDRIHLDLAPFWALPRAEMQKRLEEVQKLPETFTLVVQSGKVDIEINDKGGLEWGGTILRAIDCASLIKGFSRHLPDMRAVFSIHDQPQVYLSNARRSSLVELGLKGQHTQHLKESDDDHVLWTRSCPADSNLRQDPAMDEGESLVYDTLEATDLCQNPYLMDLHGLTLEPHGPESHPKPHTSLIPLFSLAKTSVNSDILITPLDQFMTSPGRDPEWSEKQDPRIAWRGSTTGISWMDQSTPWRKSHRVRLHNFAQNYSDEVMDFKVPELGVEGEPLRMRTESHPTDLVAEFFYDMQLSGEPIQCNVTDGTCDEMWEEMDFADFQSPEELNDYKFMLDIDGNGWSGRFRRLMSTNSVVLKTGLFTEWFQPHLIPWFMYIPTKLDYSDLPMILGFLRGSPDEPDQGFDEVSKAIARNGQCFVQRMFRVQDLQAYMFRLFLEYARLIAETDEDNDFYLESELEAMRAKAAVGDTPMSENLTTDDDGTSPSLSSEEGTDDDWGDLVAEVRAGVRNTRFEMITEEDEAEMEDS